MTDKTPKGDPKQDGKAIRRLGILKRATEGEGAADRAEGRKTRSQQKGRLRT